MTMERTPYQVQYKLRNADVDPRRRLRLSVLLTMLQEAAIAHTEALGMGREKTLDRGLLWVVTLQEVRINRLPEYDETVTLTSVPGRTMHRLFPRYYRMTDASGAVLVTGAALWALMDQGSRSMIDPEEWDVAIREQEAGWETFFPRSPKLPAEDDTIPYLVPYSYLDLNGHMNNTRYLDLAEDLMPEDLRAEAPVLLLMEYSGEARLGDEIILRRQREDRWFYLSGTAGKRIFRLGIQYHTGEKKHGL